MDHQLWALALFGGIMMFGGPEMMRHAELAERLGYRRTAAALGAVAWVTLGMSPVLAVALLRGWV